MRSSYVLRASALSLVTGLGAAILGIACDGVANHSDCLDFATCPGLADGAVVGDGPADGGEGGIVVPPGCDLTKPVADSPECVDDAVGVFVAPSGDDGAPGTKARPVRSLTKAAELAGASSRPRMYVCAGTYNESVEVKRALSIYGGFTCAGGQWQRTGAGVSWSAAKPAFALRVVGAAESVVIDSVEIAAKPGAAPGESSFGVWIADSADVRFESTTVLAANAANGETKLPKAAAPNAAKGGAAANPIGGTGSKNTCPDGDSTGGTGGTIGANDATAGQPALGGGAAGAVATDCNAGGGGGTGTGGNDGAIASVSTALGELTATTWTPAPGSDGKPGTRGQGGGGGGARSGAGGGGGAGGCGGAGGAGGGGGGASVAVAVFSSKVTFVKSRLTAATAGDGGGGAGGQPGQPPGGGGSPGTGNPFDGCAGGQGGPGGNGGAGAGGAGGVSAAILFKGASAPTVTDTTITKGTAGAKGTGGNAAGNDGPAGVAEEVFEVK